MLLLVNKNTTTPPLLYDYKGDYLTEITHPSLSALHQSVHLYQNIQDATVKILTITSFFLC